MNGIDGEVALVTGAAQGIGRASAERFAEEGASVVVADINAEGGREVVDGIESAGGDAIFVEADVSRTADVEAMVDEAVETFGRLDFAHNNVGGLVGMSRDPIADRSEEEFDRVIDVNMKGVWRGLKYELRAMLDQGSGAIVNTGSMAALKATKPGLGPYNAAKHGVLGLTRAAALQYAEEGIRVNAVCPGATATPAALESPDEVLERMAANIPMGRMVEPEEIASGVVWLCSEDASMVTGQAISIDGGQLAKG